MEMIFIMANRSTLLALAYIKESDNPLHVFCNLILYCLSLSPQSQLRHDELKDKMVEQFGLTVPNHIIDSCIRYLSNHKSIEKLKNGAGYRLIESKFDVKQFESEKNIIAYNENLLIDDIIKYVDCKFNIKWDRAEAYKNLSDLILNEKTTTDIVEDTFNDESMKDVKYITPTWYVKKYIIDLLENRDSECYRYFLSVFHGTLVLRGLFQTNDYNQDKMQKFKGTEFYFDTKILLRILGFSLPYLCETAKELLSLITNEYDGKIGVFRHVIREVQSVISFAESDMKTKGYVENFEFDYFQKENKYTADDFRIARGSVEDRLKNEFGFIVMDDIDWNDKKTCSYYIDEIKFGGFLKKRNPSWKERTIQNDVRSILTINIKRCGDYSVYFGGKKKLPVFVTNNSKLVLDTKLYLDENIENDSYVAPWSYNKLPLITDVNLMCRLWLTSKYKGKMTLSMAKSAFLFQQSDAAFYERIKLTYQEVKEKHNLNVVDLDHERFEKLKEKIIDKTNGNLDEIDDEIVAISFDELADRKSYEKDNKIKKMSEEFDIAKKSLTEMELNYIESCAKRYSKKLNILKRIFMKIIANLPTIVAVIGILLIWTIDYLNTKQVFSWNKAIGIIPLIATIVFEIIDKKILSESLIDKLSNKYRKRCIKKYIEKIKKQLSAKEKQYEGEIIKLCIENINI